MKHDRAGRLILKLHAFIWEKEKKKPRKTREEASLSKHCIQNTIIGHKTDKLKLVLGQYLENRGRSSMPPPKKKKKKKKVV